MKILNSLWLAASCLVASNIALCGQTNLLVNSGFETNYYSISTNQIAFGWTNNAYLGANLWLTRETNNPHSPTNCQRVVVSGLNATNNALLYQPFTYQAGHVYNATLWLRAASNSTVQFELRDEVPNMTSTNYEAGASAIVTVGTNWQQVVMNGGVQGGSNGEFAVNCLSDGTNWIDDASLVDVTSNYLYQPPLNTTSAVPATFFGMHVNMLTHTTNWPPIQEGLIRFWDVGLKWSQVETNTNTFIWTHFDACTNVVVTNGPSCKILYTLGGTPTWAALDTTVTNTSEPRDLNDWSNYVQAVATRYKGFINYYELWNETDSKTFYTGSITTMVAMVQIARNVITNIDPSAKILGPNITLGGLGWLEQFIQAGGPAPDIVTFHDYTTSRPESSLAAVVGVRDLLSRYPAWNGQPLWCTEGAPAIGGSDLENQGIAARAYLFWWWQNVPNWNWYAWELTNVSGSLRVPLSVNPPSENPSPAGIAYSNTVNWLLGAHMVSMNLDSNGNWAAGLQRLGFTNAHVIWNPDATTNFPIPPAWNVFQMRDLSNNITSLTNISIITASLEPVILDSTPSLFISNSFGSNITLLWPAPAAGFNLYQNTNLATTNWNKITAPLAISNGTEQVTLVRSNGISFFRLKSP